MATVGHLAAGFAISRFAAAEVRRLDTAVITAAAVAADVDFLMPLKHRGITHSVGAAMAIGVWITATFALVGRQRAWWIATLGSLSALSHAALDILTAESGVPALWPFSNVEISLSDPPLPAASLSAALWTPQGVVRALGEFTWASFVLFVAEIVRRRLLLKGHADSSHARAIGGPIKLQTISLLPDLLRNDVFFPFRREAASASDVKPSLRRISS